MRHSPTSSTTAQREARRLDEETVALRREAAEILRRSRPYRDELCRELLLERVWHGVPTTAPRS